MFFTFPDEWPGAGLLLLRAAAGSGLIVQAITYLRGAHELQVRIVLLAAFMMALGTLLLLGCLTRSAGVMTSLATLFQMFSGFPRPKVGVFETPVTAVLFAVIAAALVCLGPGAFSVDARLFGHRRGHHSEDPERSQCLRLQIGEEGRFRPGRSVQTRAGR